MPAKSKFKKSHKAPVRATFTQEVAPPDPQIISQSVAPVVVELPEPPVPLAKQGLPQPDVPVEVPVENLEQILDDDTNDSVTDRNNHVVFAFGILAALIIIIGAVVVFVMYLGSTKVPQMATNRMAVAPTASPTPAFVRSAVSFEVINASGVSGAASKAKDALMQLGYTVLMVGNSKKQATSSLVLASSVSASAVSEILADVNNLFSISSSSGSLLGSTASARIILGIK